MRALLMGWFTTVGDIEVLHHVEEYLASAGVPFDVGAYSSEISRHIPNAINIYAVNPRDYSHLCVICGPFNHRYLARRGIDLDRFAHCTRIGINLTMLEDLETYDPFDAMLGRDSNQWSFPDISFLQAVERVPVVGVCLVRRQGEYGDRQRHDRASELLRGAAERAGVATVNLHTEWPNNPNGPSSSERFESSVARVDVLLTTRLHGMVLSIKNGTPALAVDAISGGGKVIAQARAIDWPEAFVIDDASEAVLDQALERCLQPAAKALAQARAAAAKAALASFPDDFARALQAPPRGVPTLTTPTLRQKLKAVGKRFRRV